MAKEKKHPRNKKTTSGKSRKWSAGVTERSEGYERGGPWRSRSDEVQNSDALELKQGIFTSDEIHQEEEKSDKKKDQAKKKKKDRPKKKQAKKKDHAKN